MMKNLLLTALLPALLGCAIHEPAHQIIYTPEKPLTNGPAAFVPDWPSLPESPTALATEIRVQGAEQQVR